MNVDSFKTELQQVLDNDILLRKEFTELKRSLSDYRNQLIMRDEDCKRLQVTIDVLNTKLVVMERDNTSYKAELSSFKELRGTITEQLESKQQEIELRITEIQQLKDELTEIAAGYEAQIEQIRSDAAQELQKVTSEYTSQLAELRSNSHYRESGIREEYENRLSELSGNWSDKEQSLVLNHEEEITRLKQTHEHEVLALREQYTNTLSGLSSASHEEVASLKLEHQTRVMQMEETFNAKYAELEALYQKETASLREALEEQRNTLTGNFNANIEALSNEMLAKEQQLITRYETQLAEMNLLISSNSQELNMEFEKQLSDIKNSHSVLMSETTYAYEQKIASLINEYEEKLSNAVIHSNSQNSRLGEELEQVRLENEKANDRITALTVNLNSKEVECEELTTRLSAFEMQLRNETERFIALTEEFGAFKQNTLLSNDEQINELNDQITALNQSHSEYVNELSLRIDSLNEEVRNMSAVFETTTNSLALSEASVEAAQSDLNAAREEVSRLNALLSEKEQEMITMRAEADRILNELLNNKEIEFQKLLVENSTIIREIDMVQDKADAQEAEISLLKSELEELTRVSNGRVEDLKETLSAKNFEITNLEANNAALSEEVNLLKREILELRSEIDNNKMNAESAVELQDNLAAVSAKNESLLGDLSTLNDQVLALQTVIADLNGRISTYEGEIAELRNEDKVQEQANYINRLFSQVEELNDQRLALLDEKDQMAQQLLKMNEVIGAISQQVDTQQIDVSALNNHRKNVILATNSDGEGNTRMKKQINDLVREIDKCIALLSA